MELWSDSQQLTGTAPQPGVTGNGHGCWTFTRTVLSPDSFTGARFDELATLAGKFPLPNMTVVGVGRPVRFEDGNVKVADPYEHVHGNVHEGWLQVSHKGYGHGGGILFVDARDQISDNAWSQIERTRNQVQLGDMIITSFGVAVDDGPVRWLVPAETVTWTRNKFAVLASKHENNQVYTAVLNLAVEIGHLLSIPHRMAMELLRISAEPMMERPLILQEIHVGPYLLESSAKIKEPDVIWDGFRHKPVAKYVDITGRCDTDSYTELRNRYSTPAAQTISRHGQTGRTWKVKVAGSDETVTEVVDGFAVVTGTAPVSFYTPGMRRAAAAYRTWVSHLSDAGSVGVRQTDGTVIWVPVQTDTPLKALRARAARPRPYTHALTRTGFTALGVSPLFRYQLNVEGWGRLVGPIATTTMDIDDDEIIDREQQDCWHVHPDVPDEDTSLYNVLRQKGMSVTEAVATLPALR